MKHTRAETGVGRVGLLLAHDVITTVVFLGANGGWSLHQCRTRHAHTPFSPAVEMSAGRLHRRSRLWVCLSHVIYLTTHRPHTMCRSEPERTEELGAGRGVGEETESRGVRRILEFNECFPRRVVAPLLLCDLVEGEGSFLASPSGDVMCFGVMCWFCWVHVGPALPPRPWTSTTACMRWYDQAFSMRVDRLGVERKSKAIRAR